jgi:hypothetical protein
MAGAFIGRSAANAGIAAVNATRVAAENMVRIKSVPLFKGITLPSVRRKFCTWQSTPLREIASTICIAFAMQIVDGPFKYLLRIADGLH